MTRKYQIKDIQSVTINVRPDMGMVFFEFTHLNTQMTILEMPVKDAELFIGAALGVVQAQQEANQKEKL